MKKISTLLLVSFMIMTGAFAQDKYIIFLADKTNSPYSVNDPAEFLSARSIARKAAMGITIDQDDLPVNPAYETGVRNTGAVILARSRWMNTLTVQADTSQIIAAGALPYVQSYKKVYGSNIPRIANPQGKFDHEYESLNMVADIDTTRYGGAANQNRMLNVQALHDAGFTGKNMLIAVIDAGFRKTDEHHAFDSLRDAGRIKGTFDFVRNDPYVYDFSNHGTSVLSTMAALVPDSMIGTAPHASYLLLRSEDEVTEYIIEEYNWVSAAEYADSAGADVINSSLGYTLFDAASQNHSYSDMDGNTTVITKAANKAVTKGILVVNSAGNSGNDAWFYIGAPADGDKVFSVAALQFNGSIAGFSSRGPTADGRIKPDIAAQGAPSFIARADNLSYGYGSGTSFSGPTIAGFSACAWEVYKTTYPDSKPEQVKSWIKSYANRHASPDNDYGSGIPDGRKLLLYSSVGSIKKSSIRIFPNPATQEISMIIPGNQEGQNTEYRIYNLMNQLIDKQTAITGMNGQLTITFGPSMPQGMYVLQIRTADQLFSTTFLKR